MATKAETVNQATFHLFNDLPEELRLLIWEEFFLEQYACQPRAHHLSRAGSLCSIARKRGYDMLEIVNPHNWANQ